MSSQLNPIYVRKVSCNLTDIQMERRHIYYTPSSLEGKKKNQGIFIKYTNKLLIVSVIILDMSKYIGISIICMLNFQVKNFNVNSDFLSVMKFYRKPCFENSYSSPPLSQYSRYW